MEFLGKQNLFIHGDSVKLKGNLHPSNYIPDQKLKYLSTLRYRRGRSQFISVSVKLTLKTCLVNPYRTKFHSSL